MKKSFLLLVVFLGLGCSTTIPIAADNTTLPSAQMFGPGRAPIPPRPPGFRNTAAVGVPSPFSDNVFTLKVKNSVAVYGEKPLIMTALWVAGVKKPLRTYDHMALVPYVPYGTDVYVGLPPCHMLDGSGECNVRVVAQLASWRYGPAGQIIPANNVTCVERTVSALNGEAVLDWNRRMSGQVTCPGQAVAKK
jgi:hypothetical protein